MAKSKPKRRNRYVCQECRHESGRWLGQCPVCNAWGSLVETGDASDAALPSAAGGADETLDALVAGADASAPMPIAEIDAHSSAHRPTHIGELDRVLGGGLVPGASILLGGEPGVGKSTLLLQAADGLAATGANCLLVTAEESQQQVRMRAERVNALQPRCYVVAESSIAAIIAHMRALGPALVIVDSIQAVRDPRVDSSAGSVNQVRESAAALVDEAQAAGATLVLVGHVTKDGSLAGPRLLEHLVDVVLSFDGDRRHGLRVLRAMKNRFGATGEVGLFEMRADGVTEVTDPSGLLIAERRPASGSALGCTLEGRRPLMIEIQGLVVPSNAPRRWVSGFDQNRVSVICGVVEKRAGVACNSSDVFVSVAGGVRVSDPALDLALCVAIASSKLGRAVPDRVAYIGEVGLGGEVRVVPNIEDRVREAGRLGLEQVIVAARAEEAANEVLAGMGGAQAIGVSSVGEVVFGLPPEPPMSDPAD